MIHVPRLAVALVIAAASGLAFGFVSARAKSPQAVYQGAVQTIESRFKQEQSRCEALEEPAMRLCVANALSQKWRGLADAQVRLHDTPENRRQQAVVAAGGELLVQLQKCSEQAPDAQPICRDEAKQDYVRQLSRFDVGEAKIEACAAAECRWLPQQRRAQRTTSM
jgi:hypothetical protein